MHRGVLTSIEWGDIRGGGWTKDLVQPETMVTPKLLRALCLFSKAAKKQDHVQSEFPSSTGCGDAWERADIQNVGKELTKFVHTKKPG